MSSGVAAQQLFRGIESGVDRDGSDFDSSFFSGSHCVLGTLCGRNSLALHGRQELLSCCWWRWSPDGSFRCCQRRWRLAWWRKRRQR